MTINKDLWSGLITGPVWNKYMGINQLTTYADSVLLNTQIQKLQVLEKGTNSLKYKNASNFILNSKNQMISLNNGLTSKIENQIYGRIIELLNLGLWSNENNPTRKWHDQISSKAKRDSEAKAAIRELKELLNKVSISKPLAKEIVETFEQRIRTQSGNNEQYTQIKADYAEKLAADILSKNEGWKVLQTGKLADLLGQSILEDIMAFDRQKAARSFSNGGMTMYIKTAGGGKQAIIVHSLDELFQKIEKLNINETIQLDNELYDTLRQASVLSTQVKSGRNNQPILTEAKRNAISLGINGIDFFNKYDILKQIYFDKDIPWKDISQQNSSQLASLTNYKLSQEIGKTAISMNQLYFTEQGFVSASEWMKNNKRLLRFSTPITRMDKNFNEAEYHYQLYKMRS